MPEIIDPVFAKTSQNARFLLSENERFGLVFVKTGSINSGTKELYSLLATLFFNDDLSNKISFSRDPSRKFQRHCSSDKYLHEMQDDCLTVSRTILHRLEKPVILKQFFYLYGLHVRKIYCHHNFFLQVESDELNIRNSVTF